MAKVLVSNVHPILWNAAYHMALIDYAKPYMASRGGVVKLEFAKAPRKPHSNQKPGKGESLAP